MYQVPYTVDVYQNNGTLIGSYPGAPIPATSASFKFLIGSTPTTKAVGSVTYDLTVDLTLVHVIVTLVA